MRFAIRSSVVATAAALAVALAAGPRNAAAGVTITKVKMTDKTNGGEVTSGMADAVLSVQFVADATTDCEDPELTYTWDFGDGTTATGKTVSHSYGAAGAGNRSPSVTVTDTCGGSATQGGLSVAAILDIDVKKIGDINNPAGNGRICFDAIRSVEAAALPAGVDGSDKIDWSLQVGTVHSRKADMASGDLATLSEWPLLNTSWGASTLYISIDGPHVPGQQGELNLTGNASFIDAVQQIKVFYDLMGYQNPHPGGPNPRPKNWFYYWTQTSANHGTMNYSLGATHGANAWCDFGDPPSYPCYTTDSMTTSYLVGSVPSTIQNAGQTLTFIDHFAWTARHEWRHHNQATSWWGAGGRVPSQDDDADNIPDDPDGSSIEDNLFAAEGGPFDITKQDTYTADWTSNDLERNAVVTQAAWTKDSADGEDWAHPGSQWP